MRLLELQEEIALSKTVTVTELQRGCVTTQCSGRRWLSKDDQQAVLPEASVAVSSSVCGAQNPLHGPGIWKGGPDSSNLDEETACWWKWFST